MRRRLVLPCSLFVLLGPAAAGQATRVRAEVDARRVGLQDQLQLTIVVEGPAEVSETPAPAALENLRVVGGPMVSQQFSFVNGAASQSRSFVYVLQPQAAGPAQVGAVKVKLSSGEQSTAPIAVEVVPGSVKPAARPRALDPFGDEDPFAPFFGRDGRESRRGPAPKLLVQAVPSRTTLHVGEPLLLTYYVLTQVVITDLQFKDPPQYPGFWAEDLEQPRGPLRGEPVSVEGEAFQRVAIVRKLLFPTRAGTLSLPATTLRLGLQRRSLFDVGPQAVERATQPITVTAEPIPSEPGFNGAVGRFRVRATLDKTALRFGEGATLRFEVQGTGNLKWIDQGPELRIPGAKVFPPQAKSDLTVAATGMSGSRTWEYVVVPETGGTLAVPALAFSYYDPEQRRIVRAESAPLELRVDAAAGLPAAAPARAAGSGGLSLRSDLESAPARLPALGRRALAGGVGLLLLAHAALWGAARLQERGAGRAGRAPARSTRAALAQLRQAARGGLSKEAAAALIEKTLHEVFGAVEEDAGPPADERERAARELLAELRFVRYAPQLGDYSEKLRELAERAAAAVRRWA